MSRREAAACRKVPLPQGREALSTPMRRLFPPQRSTPQTSSACAAVSEITTGSEFLSLLSAIELPAKLLSAIILSFLVFSVLASSVLVLSVLVLLTVVSLTIVFVIIVLVLIVIPVSSAASGNESSPASFVESQLCLLCCFRE